MEAPPHHEWVLNTLGVEQRVVAVAVADVAKANCDGEGQEESERLRVVLGSVKKNRVVDKVTKSHLHVVGKGHKNSAQAPCRGQHAGGRTEVRTEFRTLLPPSNHTARAHIAAHGRHRVP
jgi:phenylpyruvate tautomerase PptA (4-oxalocrotonate tautomerase family)